jgi:hypothetical protein
MARTAVIAGTATSVSNRVSRRQAGRWAHQDQQSDSPPPPAPAAAPAPAPAPSGADLISQLKDLAQLKEQGILTEAEFETQKARVLGT